jgi:hypothetical protein
MKKTARATAWDCVCSPIPAEAMDRIVAKAEEIKDYDDDWCGMATDEAQTILDEYGIQSHYMPQGAGGDESHTYVNLMPSGTIVDLTVRQYIDSPRAGWAQKALFSGYPRDPRWPSVAIIPKNHPFRKVVRYGCCKDGDWGGPGCRCPDAEVLLGVLADGKVRKTR